MERTIEHGESLRKLAADALAAYEARIWFLDGAMGTGKTTFVEALCTELGVTDTVQSPTYPLVHAYSSPRGPVHHIDLYRLSSEREALDIGLEEILEGGGYCFIEWPDPVRSWLDAPVVKVTITMDETGQRRFRILEE